MTCTTPGFRPIYWTPLDGVTNRDGEPYEAFVERAATNPVSRRVKLLDLRDNIDTTRLPTLGRERPRPRCPLPRRHPPPPRTTMIYTNRLDRPLRALFAEDSPRPLRLRERGQGVSDSGEEGTEDE